MIRPQRIDHVVLRTDRYGELIAFYRDVLGCDVERVVDAHALTQLRAGDSLIDIVDVAGDIGRAGGPAPGEGGRNVDHICLQIAPFDEAELVAYLQGRGVDCGEFHDRYGAQGFGPSLYITDPAGNTVELKATVEDDARGSPGA